MDVELARLILEKGLVDKSDMDRCIQLHQKHKDRKFGELLVQQGIVTQPQLAKLIRTAEESRTAQIPGYQLMAKLGAGSQAMVCKARQISLDRIVAVKVLSPKLTSDEHFISRFYKEAQSVAKLNHPNIIQAIDFGEIGGRYYFVMEYLDGYTIQDELSKGKVYSEGEALDIIIQIARALKHAHSLGLIHRDVKPSNIMLTNDRKAKLADMGLAVATVELQNSTAETSKIFGTPYYISPEQILGIPDIDFRADIYSLGATLYHMVTGKVPFVGRTPREVMMRHLKDPLPNPQRINFELSNGLVKVLSRMMEKERERRYASTEELVKDLESLEFLMEAENPSSEQQLGQLGDGIDGRGGEVGSGRSARTLTAPVSTSQDSFSPVRRFGLSIRELILAILALTSIVLNIVLLAR